MLQMDDMTFIDRHVTLHITNYPHDKLERVISASTGRKSKRVGTFEFNHSI